MVVRSSEVFHIAHDVSEAEQSKRKILDSFVEALHCSEEDAALLRTIETFTAQTSLGPRQTTFSINIWHLPQLSIHDSASSSSSLSSAPLILCMHGHGHGCCIASWARFWAPLHRAGYRVVAFDAPCFGQSSGPAGQANLFRADDAELVIRVITSFGCSETHPCTVFAQCMGGAMFLRALECAPLLFSHNHVMENCTIGTWPEKISSILRAKKGKFLAYHEVDADHMREAVAYRRLTAMMLDESTLCTYIDNERARKAASSLGIEGNFIDSVSINVPGLSRSAEGDCFLFEPNPTCFRAIMDHVTALSTDHSTKSFHEQKAQGQVTAIEKGYKTETSIKVYVRSRPLLKREIDVGELSCCKIRDLEIDGQTVSELIVVDQDNTRNKESNRFIFSKVFEPDTSQSSVYTEVARPLLLLALNRHINVTLLAYGQTGSGKTFSIVGDKAENGGIIPHLIHELYANLEEKACVRATLVQLYNEKFYDLLNKLCLVKMNAISAATLDCRIVECTSPQELLDITAEGMSLRTQGATGMNDSSSRSHAILTISIVASGAKITIVDLAGSERVKKSGVENNQLKEAVAINASLLALGSVVSALVAKNGQPRAHIPYRDSPLTMLLSESIGGTARCAVIACISPSKSYFSETLSTLRFASEATFVDNVGGKVEQFVVPVLSEEAGKKLDAAAAVQESFFDQENGIRCSLDEKNSSGDFVHVLGNFSSGSESPVVVLLHYYGVGSAGGAFFKDWFPSLAKAGFRCLAPSFPGHGLSPGPAPVASPDSVKLGAVPCIILKRVLDFFGVRKCVLVGFDWGGGIAFEFARRHPERVACLVGWAVSYRDEANLKDIVIKNRMPRSRIALLWAKDDPLHSFKKGQKMATVLGIKITLIGDDSVQQEVVKFLAPLSKSLS